jgi:hypothetical protein
MFGAARIKLTRLSDKNLHSPDRAPMATFWRLGKSIACGVSHLSTTSVSRVSVTLHNGAGLDDGDAVDAAFAALAEHNPHLQALFVHHCSYFGDQTVRSIAEHCPHFASLVVYPELRVSDAGLLALVRACLHLASITAGASSVTDVGLLAVAENGAPFLEVLRLQTSTQVSDGTKAMLKEGCPKLRNLNLQVWWGCGRVIEYAEAVGSRSFE